MRKATKCVCKELKDNCDTTIAEGDWNTMYMTKEGHDYYIKALSDGYVSIKINYCPFCGRKIEIDSPPLK